MKQGRWHVLGNELWLEDPAGARSVPKNEVVFRAILEKEPTENWIPTNIEGIRVSRYPITPTLSLFSNSDGRPECEIIGTCKGFSNSLGISDLKRKHIVWENIWYPIDDIISEEILGLFAEENTGLGEVYSIKYFLKLRKMARSQLGFVIDLTEAGSFPVPRSENDVLGPPGIKATLYPYQLQGWQWLKFLVSEGFGGILADEMGLGKTLQIISLICSSANKPDFRGLIVATGSLLENWKRELNKFSPEISVLKHNGPYRTGAPSEIEKYQIVIVSYDTAVIDNSLLNMVKWDLVVLDEAQSIRNPNAKRTKALKRLNRSISIAVTGTPIENRLLDIWSILDFVLPGHLGDEKTFTSKFSDDPSGANLLEPLISPLILRRKIVDVAKDLPPRIDIHQIIEFNANEAYLYDQERQRLVSFFGSKSTFMALMPLRQYCAHPVLVTGGAKLKSTLLEHPKFRRMHEIVEEIVASGEKVIIFTSFVDMADLISSHLHSFFGIFTGIIDGRLAIDDRQPLIDIFESLPRSAALILNPKAGGAGLNISAANHVIHYNPEWNPALEDQASARAYRRGQVLPVTVHQLIIAGTIEEVMSARLTRKRSLSNVAVIGVEGKAEDYRDIAAALSTSPITTRS